MKIKIEKGIAIPYRKGSKGYSDNIANLKVKESVLLPTTLVSVHAIARRIWGARNFVCRTAKGGTRIWRIK